MSEQFVATRNPSNSEVVHALPFTHPAVLFPYLVLLLASASLLGWILHIPLMTSALPHFSTMKPNTALTLGLLAVCCRARGRRRDGNFHFGFAALCSLGIALTLSCGTVIEYAFGRNLGIDNLILAVPLGRFDDAAGRMALGTAVSLCLLGGSLGLLDRAPRLCTWMLLTANGISLSALLLFVLNGSPLANVPWLRSLAVPTATSLFMLTVAALALRPDRQPVLGLLRTGAGEHKTRRRAIIFAVLSLLAAVPSVVALRGNIPEAIATLMILGILLYSAQTWNAYWRLRSQSCVKP